MKDNHTVFNYVWEVTFQQFRLKFTPMEHSSWNTIYRVAKMTDRDFELPIYQPNGETIH